MYLHLDEKTLALRTAVTRQPVLTRLPNRPKITYETVREYYYPSTCKKVGEFHLWIWNL